MRNGWKRWKNKLFDQEIVYNGKLYFLFLRSPIVFLVSIFGTADPGCPTNWIGECTGAEEVIGGIGVCNGAEAAFVTGAAAGGACAGAAGGWGRGRGRMCFNLLFL